MRQQAARSLGEIGNDNAIEALGRSIKDDDPTIRYVVARALGAAGGLESLVYLHEAYSAETARLPKKMMASAIKKASSR